MPNRILRDWTDSFKVDELSIQAERFFVRLIMKVDDYGRFSSDDRLLNANLFPLKTDIRGTDISRWLTECEKAGLIVTYHVASKGYLQITDFNQRLRQRTEKFPGPEKSDRNLSATCAQHADLKRNEEETEEETETNARERAGSETEINQEELFKGQPAEGPPPGSAPPPPKYPFSEFWDLYDKKRGKAKTEKKWNRLSDKQKSEAMRALPAYVQSTPDVTYRKDPLTWLNGEHWNDEILKPKTNEGVKKSGSGFSPKNGGFNILAEQLKQQIADGARPDGA